MNNTRVAAVFPVTIFADTFQPFSSRIGVDDVVRLRFPYDKDLVSRLKALLAMYAVNHRFKTVGGWLNEHRCWFCEADAWELVKLELLYMGHSIQKVTK